ncbi:MAG: MBL fold metallo-hydrolase [Enterococcus italicus]|uniref:MBL fold metallo-hydrolase n=1 Tax=Enterococcus italicus TaxID=246144 RepID=UPI003991A2D8
MNIQQIVTGPVQENCYLLWQNNELLVVDPGADAKKISAAIKKTAATPLAIILTHTHYDHIGAVDAIRDEYQIPVYVSSDEQEWLQSPPKNLSGRHPELGPITARNAEHEFKLNTTLTIGSFSFEVVPTPGHSIGSVSFIFDSFVVCGDALFKGSIGRTDLYTGNLEQLLNSIQTQLFTLPDSFDAYPGHGEPTTIGHEKATNPFFN